MSSWIPKDVDKIYKFELGLLAAVNDIRCMRGQEPLTKVVRANVSHHKPYRSYYDEDTRKMIYEIYRDDFDRFGYSEAL